LLNGRAAAIAVRCSAASFSYSEPEGRVEFSAGLYTCSMAGSVFYKLGRIAGVQVRKAKWMWESVAGNEAEGIQAEHAVGRDMAAVVLEETPRDSDRATQALLDEIAGKLAAVVRNRLHRFQMTAIETDRPTAFALPGGFIFIARPLVQLCNRNEDDIAFVLAHEMAHVIRRHAIQRLLQQKVVNAVALVSPARGALASWIRQVGFQGLERAYSQDEEFEAANASIPFCRTTPHSITPTLVERRGRRPKPERAAPPL
jgi:predicted Zn-dependent protease